MHRLTETLRRMKRPRVLVALACLGLTAYFAHHAVAGRHGIEARQRLLERQPQISRQLVELRKARDRLKQEVALLGLEPPSRDMVEEIARDLLGYVMPSEIVWIGR